MTSDGVFAPTLGSVTGFESEAMMTAIDIDTAGADRGKLLETKCAAFRTPFREA